MRGHYNSLVTVFSTDLETTFFIFIVISVIVQCIIIFLTCTLISSYFIKESFLNLMKGSEPVLDIIPIKRLPLRFEKDNLPLFNYFLGMFVFTYLFVYLFIY